MKKIVLIALLIVCATRAAELASVPQLHYTILPRDICALVAKYKTGYELFDLENREDATHSRNYYSEQLRMSATWNTATLIPDSLLMEHQLWFSTRKFRFDNDTTHDCNEFQMDTSMGHKEKIMFDGPNNDGGPGAGVVLIADSYFGKRDQSDRKTRFYLFKQHGTEKKDSSGAQQAVVFPGQQIARRAYDGFPNRFKVPRDDRDYRTKGQYLDFCALAPYKRGIIASRSVYYTPYLNVFEYEHAANHAAPDQAFEVKMLASVCGGPRFARLAWVYGRTLLGLTQDQQLYVVALDEHEGKTSIRFCPQKTDKKITNFCLARPHNHHIVFLCDDQKNMYTANLKHRNRLGAIAMNMLTHQGKPLSHGLERVDRMWVYEDRLALMDTAKMKVLLFALNQQDWTGQRVNAVLQAKKIVRVFPWMEEPYDEYSA